MGTGWVNWLSGYADSLVGSGSRFERAPDNVQNSTPDNFQNDRLSF